MPDWEEDDAGGSDEAILTESKQKLEKPPLYKVLLHNDDYTTMDFVVFILETVFHKSEADAYKIMMAVHQQGIGVAGVFTYEIAEAKVDKVTELARAREFPLLCTLEQE
ncbi:MAG: ATP-dependent Clp protease adapter ClpS [Candidatus Melainabacteria bacterium]|nr:MAG: ATP-dependent Clp protease adapter ClpS [Candidatus Melainabacteria bacterium]